MENTKTLLDTINELWRDGVQTALATFSWKNTPCFGVAASSVASGPVVIDFARRIRIADGVESKSSACSSFPVNVKTSGTGELRE